MTGYFTGYFSEYFDVEAANETQASGGAASARLSVSKRAKRAAVMPRVKRPLYIDISRVPGQDDEAPTASDSVPTDFAASAAREAERQRALRDQESVRKHEIDRFNQRLQLAITERTNAAALVLAAEQEAQEEDEALLLILAIAV